VSHDRVLVAHDLRGDPINILLTLPGEPLGDRTGNRLEDDYGLDGETTVQFYEARSPAHLPLGRILCTWSPKTLMKVSADVSLNGGNVLALAEAKRVLRWVRDEQQHAEAYKRFKPSSRPRGRLSALATRVAAGCV